MEFTAAAAWLNTAFSGFDNGILEFMHVLEGAAGAVLTPLTKFITLIGEKGLLMFALALIFMCFSKTRKLGVCMFGAVCCGALITNIILKDLIARPRPFEAMAPFMRYWKAVGSPPESGFSFPSGHVTAAAAGMAALCFSRGKKMIAPAAVFVVLMGFSRIYLMAHYPSDVLAAILVGLFSGFVAYLIANFMFSYMEDNDDLPFFGFVLGWDLPLKLPKGSGKGGAKKQGKGEKKSARRSGRGAKAKMPARGEGRSSKRAPAEEEAFVTADDSDADASPDVDELVSAVSRFEESPAAAEKKLPDAAEADEKPGRHAAAEEAPRRSGRHAPAEEAPRRSGRHAAAEKSEGTGRSGRKKAKPSFLDGLAAAAADMGAKGKAAVKSKAAPKGSAVRTEAPLPEQAAPERAELDFEPPAPAKAAQQRPTSDWNARWEEYRARRDAAQVKTAPAAQGSAQMVFEQTFSPSDEDVKIFRPEAQEAPAPQPSPASPILEEIVAAPEFSDDRLLEDEAFTFDEESAKAVAETVESEAGPAEKEAAPAAAETPEKKNAVSGRTGELDMEEFYAILNGSFDFSGS